VPVAVTINNSHGLTAHGGRAAATGPAVSLATTAVGALFSISGGHLASHFCTASVIDSQSRDLIITAAHCVSGYSAANPAGLAFVPGYDGATPLGIWTVTRIFVDSAWSASANPNDDVAFLEVAANASGKRIEDVTGAEDLRFGSPAAALVRVVGYPDTQNQPIICDNSVHWFSPTQLEFDCENFTNGTSGGPFLVGPDPATGAGQVIGVIGGYQEGGLSPDVSYAAIFGQNVRTLYQAAVAASL
jgi:V8-like Glu-specific endopeptidase